MASHYDLHNIDGLPTFKHIELETVDSTNSFLHTYRAASDDEVTLATAEFQTAGRGATGGWESEEGMNLIFSVLTHPSGTKASRMFVLSEVIAMAVRDGLNTFSDGFKVKWPNDIYFGDKKIVGMLIENDLTGKNVRNCVMGVGVNVNQTVFRGDAPNPGSLALILGHEVDRREVLSRILTCFAHYYDMSQHGEEQAIHEAFLGNLYRKGEVHRYRDADGEFQATLTDVEPTGYLHLQDHDGKDRRYAFKEVQFVIQD